jgi:hypothetical protein
MEVLSCGPIHTILQNVAYALPACRVLVRSNGAIETSQDNSAWAAVTLTNNQAELAAAFMRTTASSAIVTVKKA